MRTIEIVITCEHAGNKVPNAYRYLFDGKEALLNSHKGWDPGALSIAKHLSKSLKVPLDYTEVTRLLVDCNRSLSNSEIFSEISSPLQRTVKKYLIKQYYHSYRDKILNQIEKLISKHHTSSVLHLSVHTFTPVLHGRERVVDIGLLFDDTRERESMLCDRWINALSEYLPDMTIMHNCPYHGADDGFTTWLRRQHSANQYLGIEIEVNQKYANHDQLDDIKHALSESLIKVKNELMSEETLNPQD